MQQTSWNALAVVCLVAVYPMDSIHFSYSLVVNILQIPETIGGHTVSLVGCNIPHATKWKPLVCIAMQTTSKVSNTPLPPGYDQGHQGGCHKPPALPKRVCRLSAPFARHVGPLLSYLNGPSHPPSWLRPDIFNIALAATSYSKPMWLQHLQMARIPFFYKLLKFYCMAPQPKSIISPFKDKRNVITQFQIQTKELITTSCGIFGFGML